MNMDREIGKIVLHVQNLLLQIERTGDADALKALENTLSIARNKARGARRERRGRDQATAHGALQALAS